MPIRVLIVDDQDLIRQGLRTILRYSADIQVVGEADNGQQAVLQAAALEPDVVLMDLKMPVLGGIPATRQIVRARPDTHVVILTTYDTDDLVYQGIRAGAQAYLLKDADADSIVEAIRGVVVGESRLSPSVARHILGEFRRLSSTVGPEALTGKDGAPGAFEALTPREAEVLGLLVQGRSNRQIAEAMVLTEGTVRNYVSAIISKLQANDRTDAVVRALRHGLAEL